MTDTMTPYEQGRHAQYTGVSIDDNPYTSRLDKQERQQWYEGWRDSWKEYNGDALGLAHGAAYF